MANLKELAVQACTNAYKILRPLPLWRLSPLRVKRLQVLFSLFVFFFQYLNVTSKTTTHLDEKAPQKNASLLQSFSKKQLTAKKKTLKLSPKNYAVQITGNAKEKETSYSLKFVSLSRSVKSDALIDKTVSFLDKKK